MDPEKIWKVYTTVGKALVSFSDFAYDEELQTYGCVVDSTDDTFIPSEEVTEKISDIILDVTEEEKYTYVPYPSWFSPSRGF